MIESNFVFVFFWRFWWFFWIFLCFLFFFIFLKFSNNVLISNDQCRIPSRKWAWIHNNLRNKMILPHSQAKNQLISDDDDTGRTHPKTTWGLGKTYPYDENVTKGSRFVARLEKKPRNVLGDALGCIERLYGLGLLHLEWIKFRTRWDYEGNLDKRIRILKSMLRENHVQ